MAAMWIHMAVFFYVAAFALQRIWRTLIATLAISAAIASKEILIRLVVVAQKCKVELIH